MTANVQTSVSRARLALMNRLLVLGSTDDILANLSHVDQKLGGVVVLGSQAHTTVRRLRHAYPGMLILEQSSAHVERQASAATPFILPTTGDGGIHGSLFDVEMSIDDQLDAQIANGASLAILPTGFIAANDVTALRAAVTKANMIERDDTILHLPLSHVWCSGVGIDKVIAAVKRSSHPVAVSLGHRSDPGSQPGVVEGLRRLVREAPDVSLWFTDLCGIDALAHGARAAAIGLAASHRHIVAPGETAHSPTVTDRSPNVLMPDLLRFRKSQHMTEQWFASTPAPTCDAPLCCNGQPLNRFDGSTEDRNAAHRHNVIQLMAMHRALLEAPSREDFWADRLKQAEIAHLQLALRTGVKTIKPVGSVKRWIELNSSYGTES